MTSNEKHILQTLKLITDALDTIVDTLDDVEEVQKTRIVMLKSAIKKVEKTIELTELVDQNSMYD